MNQPDPVKAALDARYNGRAAVEALDPALAPPSPVPAKPGDAAAAVPQSSAPPAKGDS